MKTAIQEFIEDELRGETKPMAYYLEKEKYQIENAVTYGNRQEYYDATEELGTHYYKQTYLKTKL